MRATFDRGFAEPCGEWGGEDLSENPADNPASIWLNSASAKRKSEALGLNSIFLATFLVLLRSWFDVWKKIKFSRKENLRSGNLFVRASFPLPS